MNSQNMGDFVKLPAEIRIKIWKHLRPCSGPSPTFDVGAEGGLGILRACRQLHDEATFYLYEKETLKFRIRPVYESWFIIENSHGAVWKISNFREPLAKKLSELPFSKLEKLEITIDAPHHNDRYQLYFLFRHVFELVDFLLLRQPKGLPAIDIKLCDSDLGTWVTDDGKARFYSENSFWTFEADEVLYPFVQLRNIPKACISVAEAIMEDGHPDLVEEAMERDVPFGQYRKHAGIDDEYFRRIIRKYYHALESALDEIPGKAMNMLRLERFMFWYDEKGNTRYIGDWERFGDLYPFLDHRSDRHDLLITFNPLSANMQKIRRQLELPSYMRSSTFKPRDTFNLSASLEYLRSTMTLEEDHSLGRKEVRAATGLKSYWSTEEWRRYYPDGLPPWRREPCEGPTVRKFVCYLEEHDRHKEGSGDDERDEDLELTQEEERIIAQDRINAQASLIKFGAEHEVAAVLNIISRSPCPKKDKKQKKQRTKD